jgi:hypothetical protein
MKITMGDAEGLPVLAFVLLLGAVVIWFAHSGWNRERACESQMCPDGSAAVYFGREGKCICATLR